MTQFFRFVQIFVRKRLKLDLNFGFLEFWISGFWIRWRYLGNEKELLLKVVVQRAPRIQVTLYFFEGISSHPSPHDMSLNRE